MNDLLIDFVFIYVIKVGCRIQKLFNISLQASTDDDDDSDDGDNDDDDYM